MMPSMDTTTVLMISMVVAFVICLLKLALERINYIRIIDRIPGPPAYPFVGSALEVVKNSSKERFAYFDKRSMEYYPLFRTWRGPLAEIHLMKPEHVEIVASSVRHIDKSYGYRFLQPWLGTGLLTSTGQKWHERRKLLSPAFHFKILEDFVEVFCEKTKILLELLEKKADGNEFDIYPFVTLCALDVICETAMGTPVNAQKQSNSQYIKAIYEISRLTVERGARPWLHADFMFRFSQYGKRYENCLSILHGFTKKVISERRLLKKQEESETASSNEESVAFGQKKRKAFLDLLLDASSEGKALSDDDIREEVDTFMFEGHDTTTAGMVWTLFLLGNETAIQENVFEELDSIFGDSDRPPTMHDLGEMKYLERVIKESLRLYPSVPFIGRQLNQDVEIDKYLIPAGTMVLLHIYHLHRCTEQFQNPDAFDPDNFLPERMAKRHPYAYLPFSAGPRNCIGQKFALLEEKTILSSILRKFRIEAVEKRKDIVLMSELILRPDSGLRIKMHPRNFDEDEQEVSHGIDILDRFDSDDLMELRKVFFDEKEMSRVEGKQVYSGLPLSKMEFVKAVDRIIGSSTYSVAASNLFDQLSKKNTQSEKDIIWWEQILDAIIDKIQAQDSDSHCLRVVEESALKVHAITHCKRENIVKLVPLDTDTSFCYVAVSKYGQVGVYDGEINLLESYRVMLGAHAQTDESSRSTCTWVNDAIALSDATAILLAVSDRSLHFLTAAGLAHTPMFLISGIPNSPQCLSYHPGEPSLLFFGDDRGDITLMRFYQPAISLFRRTSTDRSNSYFWRELEGQDPWVTISVDHNVHGDTVREIKYVPDNGTIVSCSSDPNASVVIRYLSGKRVPYIFKMTRGVRCFHLDRGLKLLVTGSTDNVVRIWNPVVNKMPIAVLYGHKTSIVDVRILRQYNSALSISMDGVLKVWDIEDNCCLQTIGLDIPVFSIVGKMIEFGSKTIYPGPSSAKPPLARQPKSSKKSSLKQSHPASLLSTASATTKPSCTSTVGTEWLRAQLVVVCCNYAVTLPLTRHAHAQAPTDFLPPPLREKEPLVPSPWLRADARTARMATPQDNIPDTSKISSLSEDRDLSEVISPRALQFIRHGPSDFKPKFKSLLSPAYGLYQSRTQQQVQDDDKQMASMVEQCAPHLALKLYQPEEIKFSQPLPVTRRMKSFDLSSPQKLMRVKLKSDTASSIQGSCNGSTLHSSNSRTADT